MKEETQTELKPYVFKNCDCEKDVLNFLKRELEYEDLAVKKYGKESAYKTVLEYQIAMINLTLGFHCS